MTFPELNESWSITEPKHLQRDGMERQFPYVKIDTLRRLSPCRDSFDKILPVQTV